jgi:sulfur carrier protein ThiS
MELEALLALEAVLVVVEVEQSLLAAQEQMDHLQAQEQMQGEIRMLVAVVVEVEEHREYQQELAAQEAYQLYTTERRRPLRLVQMGQMFQSILPSTLLAAAVDQQVLPRLQWREETEDCMVREAVEAVEEAGLHRARVAMDRRALWL